MSRPIQIRASEQQRTHWEYRARLEGRTLSDWIRRACDAAAEPERATDAARRRVDAEYNAMLSERLRDALRREDELLALCDEAQARILELEEAREPAPAPAPAADPNDDLPF